MGKAKIHIAGIALIIFIALAGLLVEQQRQILFYVSSYGFLSLVAVIFVLAIPLFMRFRNSTTAYLIANRRWIGIYTFIFALIHVLIALNFFFKWNPAALIENPYRIMGALALLALAAMTATSNNASMRKLGKNWKRLQYVVYPALIIIIAHAAGAGQIFMKNNIVLAVIVAVSAIVIVRKITLKLRIKQTQENKTTQ